MIISKLREYQQKSLPFNDVFHLKSRLLDHVSNLQIIGGIDEHFGCVNRLQWSDDGSLLGSCSDDCHVLINDVINGIAHYDLETNHVNNLLGLRFHTENGIMIITGGVDAMVEVHEVRPDGSRAASCDLLCHIAPVSYIEMATGSRNCFFSASQDGYVRQYDSRLPHFGCIPPSDMVRGAMLRSANCLINLPIGGIYSIRSHPYDPNYLLVTTSDSSFVAYDRRMCSLFSPRQSNNLPCITYSPELIQSRRYRALHPTYAEYSTHGHEIVATYQHGHIYVFDVHGKATSSTILDSYVLPTSSAADCVTSEVPMITSSQSYIGASNWATIIKEAVFIGDNDEYIGSGSDDGKLYIWDKGSGQLVFSAQADAECLNCVQPHPVLPLLATSGLEDVIRLWGPKYLRHRYRNVETEVRQSENSLLGAEDSDDEEQSDDELEENDFSSTLDSSSDNNESEGENHSVA